MVKKYTAEDLVELAAKDKLDELEYATKNMSQKAVRGNMANAISLIMKDTKGTNIESALKDAKEIHKKSLLQKALMSDDNHPEINLQPFYNEKIVNPRLKVFNDMEAGADLGFIETGKKNPIINVNEKALELFEPEGIAIHEGQHTIDELKGFIPDDERKILEAVKKNGLGNAKELFKGHHKKGFFEYDTLLSLAKNKKLQAAMPLVGPALGAYSMLESGDVFAADPTGMFQSDNVGEGSDEVPDQGKKDIFNARMKKTKQLMKDK